MRKKSKLLVNNTILWIKAHIWQLAIVVTIHIIAIRIVNLPYINLITSLISFMPIIIDFIAIILLFKPKKEYLLYVGLGLFPLAALLSLVRVNRGVEMLGNLSYLFIFSYIALSLKEVKK